MFIFYDVSNQSIIDWYLDPVYNIRLSPCMCESLKVKILAVLTLAENT